jgi:hypothetical protein
VISDWPQDFMIARFGDEVLQEALEIVVTEIVRLLLHPYQECEQELVRCEVVTQIGTPDCQPRERMRESERE